VQRAITGLSAKNKSASVKEYEEETCSPGRGKRGEIDQGKFCRLKKELGRGSRGRKVHDHQRVGARGGQWPTFEKGRKGRRVPAMAQVQASSLGINKHRAWRRSPPRKGSGTGPRSARKKNATRPISPCVTYANEMKVSAPAVVPPQMRRTIVRLLSRGRARRTMFEEMKNSMKEKLEQEENNFLVKSQEQRTRSGERSWGNTAVGKGNMRRKESGAIEEETRHWLEQVREK